MFHFSIFGHKTVREFQEQHKLYKGYVSQFRSGGIKQDHTKQTNKNFTKSDTTFIKCCEVAKIKVTPRQASKYRNKQGKAYNFRNQLGE